MNNTTEIEVRPRPLSAGIWTFFSWLRRDDRSISSESLSSAGSDRTAASFAFLAPANYRTSSPFVLPPPGPPTDTYKKRVHDRNLRRQHDRDLTLHRKYGLFKSDGSYDAFSLPPARRANCDVNNKWERERRAASECLQRRAVHVPGKRRAPEPPSSTAAGTSTLPRRHARKRPAPQPPRKLADTNKENYIRDVNAILNQMNADSSSNKQKSSDTDVTGCKSEKYSKKEASAKDAKVRSERSFLKQIFENKKRNSAIDTSTVKILPSISELDKQAAEIIQSMKSSEQNNRVGNIAIEGAPGGETGTWFCVNCLRKYNPSVAKCVYCIPVQKSRFNEAKENGTQSLSKGSSSTQTERNLLSVASSHKSADEKQKLKEMLKEMKDSLPKKQKHHLNERVQITNSNKLDYDATNQFTPSETPTLRVGSTIINDNKTLQVLEPEPSNATKVFGNAAVITTHKYIPVATQKAVPMHHVVVSHNADVKNDSRIMENKTLVTDNNVKKQPVTDSRIEHTGSNKLLQDKHRENNEKRLLHTPLRISSLLNPVYIPKEDIISPKPTQELRNTQSISPESSNFRRTPSKPLSDSRITTAASTHVEIAAENPTRIYNKPEQDKPKTTTEKLPNEIDSPPVKLRLIKNTIPAPNSKNIRQESIQTSSSSSISNSKDCKSNISDAQNQHIRRRTLISQLEQSIAKGDERAAADAAVKLAQLRLSCSVLSYSSQILANASTSSTNVPTESGPVTEVVKNASNKNEPETLNLNTRGSYIETKQPYSAAAIVTTKNVKGTSIAEKNVANLPSPLSTKIASYIPQTKNANLITQRTQLDQPSTSKYNINNNQNDNISIAVLVEDREATRGPVQLHVKRQAILRDLRQEAQISLGLASTLQRWIIGRKLCTDNDTPVASLAGADFSAPFYLCIVESETNPQTSSSPNVKIKTTEINKKQPALQETQGGNFYTELVQLEQQALVPNAENFECGVCMEQYSPGRGVVLRDCVHIFCKDCLSDVVRHCEEPNVACPAMGCNGILEEREIRGLVTPEDYERWLARGLSAAESGTRNAFHCRTRDCKGWALCEPGVLRFPCPVCNAKNCVPCQAIHDGVPCEQHQARLKEASDTNQTDEGTRSLLNSLIRRGEALECPECKAIITKKWGCDWVKCSACKTEICWVTRGRRWGPAGRGDTSAGCRCGVEGKKCHPSCGYCH